MFQKGVLTRRDVRSNTEDGDGWLVKKDAVIQSVESLDRCSPFSGHFSS